MERFRVNGLVAKAPRRWGVVGRLQRPLYANALYLWANAVAMAVGGFAFWALAARLYSAEEVGLGAASLSAMTLLATFSHLGLGMGLVRFLPELKGRGPSLLNLGLSISGLMAVLASGIFLAGLPIWSSPLSYLREQPFHAAGFALFTVAATATIIQDQAFIAVRRAGYLLGKNPLSLVLRVALLGFFASLWGPFGIVAASGLASLVGLFIGLSLLRRALPSYQPNLVLERGPGAFLHFAIGNHVADLMLGAPALVLPIMVVNVLGSGQGAYFYVGWFLGHILLVISYSLALSLFAEGSHDRASLAVLSWSALALALLVVGSGGLLVALTGDKLLLAFGSAYSREAAGLVRLIAVASLPSVLVHLYLSVQRVRKDIPALVSLSALVALVTLGTSYLLLPRLGIEGAGVGILAGYGLGAVVALVRLWAEVKRAGTVALALLRSGSRKEAGL